MEMAEANGTESRLSREQSIQRKTVCQILPYPNRTFSGCKSVKWLHKIRAFRRDPIGIKRLLGQSRTAVLGADGQDKAVVGSALAEAKFPALTKWDVLGRGKQQGVQVGGQLYDELAKSMVLV